MPKKEEKKIKFIKDEDNKEKPIEKKITIKQPEESPQFKKIALEELMSPDSEPTNLEQGAKWVRIFQGEKEEEKETPIYDLDKSLKTKGYSSVEDYSTSASGDYESISPAGANTPAFQDQNQDGFNPMNQAKSYETSGEHELKERRKREFW